jgi:hypothetical protein
MKPLSLLLWFSLTCAAQSLTVSQFALIGANIADTASSWGGYELNPALGRGEFGARQAVIKSAVIAGMILAENHIVKRNLKYKKALVIANWIGATMITGAATSNWVRK